MTLQDYLRPGARVVLFCLVHSSASIASQLSPAQVYIPFRLPFCAALEFIAAAPFFTQSSNSTKFVPLDASQPASWLLLSFRTIYTHTHTFGPHISPLRWQNYKQDCRLFPRSFRNCKVVCFLRCFSQCGSLTLAPDLQIVISSRQKLEAQKTENLGVQGEFNKLKEGEDIYKLVGPVLLKQDKVEAEATVKGRLEFIGKEM